MAFKINNFFCFQCGLKGKKGKNSASLVQFWYSFSLFNAAGYRPPSPFRESPSNQLRILPLRPQRTAFAAFAGFCTETTSIWAPTVPEMYQPIGRLRPHARRLPWDSSTCFCGRGPSRTHGPRGFSAIL